MSWIVNFLFKSSLGQKLVMSLSGLFLILFLVIHLLGNLQLMSSDGGKSFNIYAYFMTHNPLIKLVSYALYASILIHTIQGLYLYFMNRKAKGSQYAVSTTKGASIFSRYMAHLGTIIFVFIIIHLYQFWLKMKLGQLPELNYQGYDHVFQDLYTPVVDAYKNIGTVIFYVFCMLIIAFHLWHGFQSAFQSLGLNHKKYTPLIKFIGILYAILIPLGFAIIPIYLYLNYAA
ncbi:MAG: succinate dehydrogenase cytochrome b subunit [Saprospiraceae bacterium]|nr:succinate dehydrogenase cytochrome b subunit [Saprospiraceae bacterium]